MFSFINQSKKVFCFLLIIFSIICCKKNNNNYEIEDNDNASEWINRVRIPSSSVKIFDGEELSFSIVPEDKNSEYIKRLESVQYIELGEDEFYKFSGKSLNKKHALAIRAIFTQRGGYFNVRKNERNEYYVHYMVMGSRIWEFNKAVLIIETDDIPIEIFFGYTVVK